MKKLLSRTIWTLVVIYALLMITLHIPVFQAGIADIVGSALEDKIGAEVEVKRVNLGFLNRIVVDELVVFDKNKERMLRVPRLSAKIDVIDLMQGKINLSSAQIFGLDANIYKNNPKDDYNFQFVIDSLSSKEDKEKRPFDLHISSLVILNGKIKHNLRYEPIKPEKFDANHMNLSRFSSHIILYKVTDDSLDINVKRLSLKEACGLNIRNLALRLKMGKGDICVNDFSLATDKSEISVPSLAVSYRLENKKLKEKGLIANVKAEIKSLALNEVGLFLPYNFNDFPVIRGFVDAKCTDGNIVSSISMNANDDSFLINTKAECNHVISNPNWKANKLTFLATGNLISKINNITKIPTQLLSLGDVKISGRCAGTKHSASFDGEIVTSECGKVELLSSFDNGEITAKAKTSSLSLGKILSINDIGNIATEIEGKANIKDKKLTNARINANFDKLEYKGYPYSNIHLDGTFDKGTIAGALEANDPNVNLHIAGQTSLANTVKSVNASVNVERLNLAPLNLIKDCKEANICFSSDIDLNGSNIDDFTGKVSFNQIFFHGSLNDKTIVENDINIDRITLSSYFGNKGRELSLSSDFADISLKGEYRISALKNSFLNLLKSHLPSIAIQKTDSHLRNNFLINAEIRSAYLAKRFLGVDITTEEPLTLNGYVNDFAQQANIYCSAPSLLLYGKQIDNLKLLIWTPEQSLRSNVNFTLRNAGKSPLAVLLESDAKNDILTTSLSWDNHQKEEFSGQLNTVARFSSPYNGSAFAKVSISPSNIHVGDSIWRLHSKDIIYSENKLSVDHFSVENSNQHIYINGVASKYPSDSLSVDLQNVDVAYIMDLINFHSVEFGGLATGHLTGHSLLATPEAKGHLDVKGFLFEDGHLGDFHADVVLNNEEKQLDINAFTEEKGDKIMDIIGFVSPQRSGLDLAIKAEKVPLEFLLSYCGSFMKDIDATGKGNIRVSGPFAGINLTGQIVANGALTVSSLNCRYKLHNDTITFVPDDMRLVNQPIYDKYGNVAYLTGGLHHHNLSRMTYDFDIKANKFLCYDFHEFEDNSFYGTAILTGDCKITGRNSELTFDVNGDVEPGSSMVYNATSPDALSKQEFITWNSASKKRELQLDSLSGRHIIDDEKDNDVRTNMRMNFLINVTPDATLKVLMDAQTGDCIDLHGTGVLRANYYNKGKFDLFGNYLINNGTYKLTIQNVVHRNFDFLSGGSINFGGDPYDAALALRARYTLNSVSLSDLNIGNSFSSNNIRVDCLMDITGTPGAPVVTFNLEPHTNNTDVKQMIYSLINSEEETNQQVLYLLSVGRFYAQTGNNAVAMDARGNNQTTLAMQSILSGTLSQQMNNILSKFVNSNNWNFGANISPGDEGFNNAEYEGLLNGSLLNNRLLINGQFGYRDNAATATQGFIGDFDVRYHLFPNGNLAIRVYNQTNDRYFTKNALNTQGLGLIIKHDFNSWRDMIRRKNRNAKTKREKK